MVKYSVIIPIYNEEGSLAILFYRLEEVMEKLGLGWEVIFINDGSSDSSLQQLSRVKSHQGNLVILDLNKNYGKSLALQAGFDQARGEIIIMMDGDLQHDPKDIPGLLAKLQEGFDVVCGFRSPRLDPWLKIVSARIACALRHMICKESIHDLGCAFRVFRKTCLENIYFSGGMHRFFTLIMLKSGHKIGEIKINHRRREFGRSKYNIRNRIFSGIKDLITMSTFDAKKMLKKTANYEIKKIIRK